MTQSVPPVGQTGGECAFYETHFTLELANASLVYLRRVVRDLRQLHQRAFALERKFSENVSDEAFLHKLTQELTRLEDRRIACLAELQQLGVALTDEKLGSVCFPAWYHGREILYCWAYGEDRISGWHEKHEDNKSRKPLNMLLV